ncbi:chromosomal replication initiator protein DnaA [Entomospira culicis]|uniref:Chromosomal replication initiator protein DnaA n=1 Tax=Entomospira culicis TaxID=2719989 RepID=A0A968KX87_9SPIO|nr:chromosomal replication initiator protein DnaA [Entomospira culicis]NIZ19873.1 chromosomal replication initiator protein DnaA [Entomospira culicis]NIZ70087.1 chromosomal replication initiator protein DnaA [Entomospira culicis]WDI37191.1 chromosomal replication initiator protein DnaA [Entomospira culicis]WDI38820.1 chromosomal replication initiator protein DnaA [Entomospira culicis]
MFTDNTEIRETLQFLVDQNEITETERLGCEERMHLASFQNNVLEISTPSRYYRDRYEERYKEKMEEHLSQMEGRPITIEFSVRPSSLESQNPSPTPPPETNKPKQQRPAGLSLLYTFETFVPGENSLYPYNAAIAIAKKPGGAYNPCLIYGGVGLGKTHLMQAIGNYIYDHNPHANIIFISAEKMFHDLASHTRGNSPHAFREKYRNADVLLMDDIHLLQRKVETQNELFYVFNELYGHQKQIVFTCDRPISELQNFSSRLTSRFERGLTVDLQPPTFETKIAIIKKKLEIEGKEFPPEVIELIANTIQTNVRDLEAAITNIHAYADLTGEKITLESTIARLKATFAGSLAPQGTISSSKVQKIIADYFDITVNDLKSKRKTKNIVYPRQLAMYILRQITDLSTTEIGLEFGGRDHTTVMHACQKIEDLKIIDPNIESTIRNLIRSVKENGEP